MLKLFIFSAIFATVAFAASDDGCTDAQRKDFDAYKQEFEKTYPSQAAEDQARKCFCKADNKIKEHNANNKNYQQGHNADSDRCFKVGSSQPSYQSGYKHDEGQIKSGEELPSNNRKVGAGAPGGRKINSGIDYRNATGPVKNQGNCSCDWSMSATSVLSYHNAMYGNKSIISMSDQYSLDCIPQKDDPCTSGNPLNVYLMSSMNGTPSALSYPFKGAKGKCRATVKTIFKSNKPAYVCPKGNETMMQSMLDNFGPGVIIMSVANCSSFWKYKSGVFYDETCTNPTSDPETAMTLVGYGVDKTKTPYWIIKNSWGRTWGENGYARVRRGSNQMNIAMCYLVPCPPQLPQCAPKQ